MDDQLSDGGGPNQWTHSLRLTRWWDSHTPGTERGHRLRQPFWSMFFRSEKENLINWKSLKKRKDWSYLLYSLCTTLSLHRAHMLTAYPWYWALPCSAVWCMLWVVHLQPMTRRVAAVRGAAAPLLPSPPLTFPLCLATLMPPYLPSV